MADKVVAHAHDRVKGEEIVNEVIFFVVVISKNYA